MAITKLKINTRKEKKFPLLEEIKNYLSTKNRLGWSTSVQCMPIHLLFPGILWRQGEIMSLDILALRFCQV